MPVKVCKLTTDLQGPTTSLDTSDRETNVTLIRQHRLEDLCSSVKHSLKSSLYERDTETRSHEESLSGVRSAD